MRGVIAKFWQLKPSHYQQWIPRAKAEAMVPSGPGLAARFGQTGNRKLSLNGASRTGTNGDKVRKLKRAVGKKMKIN